MMTIIVCWRRELQINKTFKYIEGDTRGIFWTKKCRRDLFCLVKRGIFLTLTVKLILFYIYVLLRIEICCGNRGKANFN